MYYRTKEVIQGLYDALAHGDEEHRAWLREAITAHFSGKPIPPPRGSGSKEALEKRNAELEGENKRLQRQVEELQYNLGERTK